MRQVTALVFLAGFLGSCSQYGGSACEALVAKACEICPTNDVNEILCLCFENGTLYKDDIPENYQSTLRIENDSDAERLCTEWILEMTYPGDSAAASCKRDLEYLKTYEANACEDIGWTRD